MDITQEIKDLKEKGVSYRSIAKQLNVSLGRVQRSLKGVSGRIVDNETRIGQEIKERLEKLEKIAVTKQEIDLCLAEFKEQIQRFLEERTQKTLNYYINNTLNPLIEIKIKEGLQGN